MSLKRFCEFFSLLSPWQSGLKSIEVAAAFESPAQNQVARRHGAIAFSALLLGAALLVAAALLNGIPNRRFVSERLGECGVACLIICVYQGLRYKEANGLLQNTNLEDDERMK